MGTKGIKRSKDLHFEVPAGLAEDIDNLVDAIERGDPMLDCYMAQLEGSARMVEEDHDRWLYEYYLLRGWQNDAEN